jgi:hypothetical protein
MFLSRLTLNARDQLVRRDLARPYQMHRTLMNSYPYPRVENRCDLLFRLEPPRHGPPVVLVQTRNDPGEWPGTYDHVREVAMPLCAAHGIEFVTIDGASYPVRDARSLFAWLEARHQIPVAGPNRICTRVAKVERFERWAADRFGAGAAIEVWIGFEAGEEARAAKDEQPTWGDAATRGVYWELATAVCLLQAGSDIMVMRHPQAAVAP